MSFVVIFVFGPDHRVLLQLRNHSSRRTRLRPAASRLAVASRVSPTSPAPSSPAPAAPPPLLPSEEARSGDGLGRSTLDSFGKPAITAAGNTNPWWSLLEVVKCASGKLGKSEIFPASTDARYFRQIGLPVFGFSPMANTPILLHDHNEFPSEDEYLKGIGIYEPIIRALATHEDGGEDDIIQARAARRTLNLTSPSSWTKWRLKSCSGICSCSCF